MNSFERLFIIRIAFLLFIFLMFVGIFLMVIYEDYQKEHNCEKHEVKCFRTEAVFVGTKDIETRCENNFWDIKKEVCVKW